MEFALKLKNFLYFLLTLNSQAYYFFLKAMFEHLATSSDHLASHHPTFVVKVRHDKLEPFVLFPQEIAYRNSDIVVGDIGGSCGGGIASFDQLGGNT